MGMFDYVRVDCRLPVSPDSELRILQYQSKDIKVWIKHAYEMQYLIITEHNHLCNQGNRIDFSGDMCFYTNTKKFGWVEFVAKVHEGYVVDIIVNDIHESFKLVSRKYKNLKDIP